MAEQPITAEALEISLLRETSSVFMEQLPPEAQPNPDSSYLLSQRDHAYGSYALLFAETAQDDTVPSDVSQHIATIQAVSEGRLPSEQITAEQPAPSTVNDVELVMQAARYVRQLHAQNMEQTVEAEPGGPQAQQTPEAAERKRLVDRQLAIAASTGDNEAYDSLWHQYGRRVADAVAKKTSDGEPLPYTPELSLRLKGYVLELSERKRSVTILKTLGGLKGMEVASLLEISYANVNVTQGNAIKRLVVALDKEAAGQTADESLSSASSRRDSESAKTRDLSDQQLLECMQSGDTAVFNALHSRHSKNVWRFARSKMWDMADEIVQLTFTRLYTRITGGSTVALSFDHEDGAAAYLTTIAKSVIADIANDSSANNATTELHFEATDQQFATDEMSALDRIVRQEELAELAVITQSLGQLTVGQRAVIDARFYKNLSVPETAALLGISSKAVNTRQHSALTRLRAHFIDNKSGNHNDSMHIKTPTAKPAPTVILLDEHLPNRLDMTPKPLSHYVAKTLFNKLARAIRSTDERTVWVDYMRGTISPRECAARLGEDSGITPEDVHATALNYLWRTSGNVPHTG